MAAQNEAQERTVMQFDRQSQAYRSTCGMRLAREHDTLTDNGNPIAGRWALRNATGKLIDFNRYRNDIEEHNNLRLVGHE